MKHLLVFLILLVILSSPALARCRYVKRYAWSNARNSRVIKTRRARYRRRQLRRDIMEGRIYRRRRLDMRSREQWIEHRFDWVDKRKCGRDR